MLQVKEWCTLKKFQKGDLEQYSGKLELSKHGWKNDSKLPLGTAAKLFNPQNKFNNGICGFKTGCRSMRFVGEKVLCTLTDVIMVSPVITKAFQARKG